MRNDVQRRGWPIGLITAVPLVAGLIGLAFVLPEPTPTPADGPPAAATADVVAMPSSFATTIEPPPPPSPTALPTGVDPSPTAYPGAPIYAKTHGPFHEGAWVRVNANAGDCLNARLAPSLDPTINLINMCLPDGTEGYITGLGEERDGHWWWIFVGAGYVADDYLTYVRDVSLSDALAPQLVGLGSIAFLRDPGEVWLMQSDGSGQRRLYAANTGDSYTYISDLSWSPDGTRLSFNVPRSDSSDRGTIALVVIDLQGTILADVHGVAGRGWSPDGTRIGLIQGAQPQQMGGRWSGVPGWLDIATGDLHLIGNAAFYQQDPPAFNFDGTLLVTGEAPDDETTTRRLTVFGVDGHERARIDPPANVMYASPLWAPESNRIAFHIIGEDRPRYAIYEVTAGSIIARGELPAPNPNLGGKCGGGDMWRSSWSRDGRSLLYSYTNGLSGSNGIWTWDIATGAERLIPAFSAGVPSAGPSGHVVFDSGLFVMAGDTRVGLPVLITNGRAPVWSPQ